MRLHVIASIAVERDLRAIESRIHRLLSATIQGGAWFAAAIDYAQLATLVQNAQVLLDAERQPKPVYTHGTPDAIGERIMQLRNKHQMRQTDLAKAAQVPLSTINMLESGVRKGEGLSVETARKLARALTVTLDYLVGMYEEDKDSELLPAAIA
jgi:DNA-binding XRE family transcriptional regulator